jgi:hypothetical protein
MDPAHSAPHALPPDLRAKLDEQLQARPALRGPADVLLAKHAAATTPAERARVEGLLRDLIAPPRRGGGSKWAVAALLLPVAGFVGWKAWSQQAHADALARSIPTVARVLRTEPGDCFATARKLRCLRLELEVYQDGGAPYTGSLTHEVPLEWTSRVQPGAWIAVGVDREDPYKIFLDEEALKLPPPPPPTGAQ